MEYVEKVYLWLSSERNIFCWECVWPLMSDRQFCDQQGGIPSPFVLSLENWLDTMQDRFWRNWVSQLRLVVQYFIFIAHIYLICSPLCVILIFLCVFRVVWKVERRHQLSDFTNGNRRLTCKILFWRDTIQISFVSVSTFVYLSKCLVVHRPSIQNMWNLLLYSCKYKILLTKRCFNYHDMKIVMTLSQFTWIRIRIPGWF